MSTHYKGICVLQTRCRNTAAECKFLHIPTEETIKTAVNNMMKEIKQLIADSNIVVNKELGETSGENESQMAYAWFEESMQDEKVTISEPCIDEHVNCLEPSCIAKNMCADRLPSANIDASSNILNLAEETDSLSNKIGEMNRTPNISC